MRFVTIVGAVIWCSSAAAECANDNDCKGDRVCEDGRCVGAAPMTQVKPEPVEAPPPQRYGSAFIDPLGFLVFGPTLGIEAGAFHVSATLYGRWFDGGLASNLLFLDHTERYDFSFGLGLRTRYYVRDGFAGAHFGVGVEWVRTQVESPSVLLVIVTNLIVPQAEAGYRWAWTNFYLGLAGSIGYAERFGWITTNMPGGTRAATAVPSDPSAVFFAAKFELGVFF